MADAAPPKIEAIFADPSNVFALTEGNGSPTILRLPDGPAAVLFTSRKAMRERLRARRWVDRHRKHA